MILTKEIVTSTISDILNISPYKGNVIRVGLFGSIARGNATVKSDADFVIDFRHPKEITFDNTDSVLDYCYLCSEIEDKFKSLYKKSVSIIEAEALTYDNNRDFKNEIEKDLVWIWQ